VPGTPPLAEARADLTARFERDVTPLVGALHRQALRMTHNHADAEDLLQDTLVKAFGGFRTFRQGSNLNAWLHRILVNTYISGYRKTQRRPAQYPTDEISDLALAAAARHSATGLRSAEDQALDRLPDSDVLAAIQALPEQFRRTVYYADVAGFRFKEIAELTGAPIGTVMSRLHRGRRQLRGQLAEGARQRGYHHARTPYRQPATVRPVPQTA
jgi:RNA polymerase sigma-70 factor, ECF subfamily